MPGEALRALDGLRRDLRYTLRVLRYHGRLTITALTTLAVGIGAVVVVFGVFQAVVLRAVPGPSPGRLVSVTQVSSSNQTGFGFSHQQVRDVQTRVPLFEVVGSYQFQTSMSLADGSGSLVTDTVSTNFFDLFQVAPIAGRTFNFADGDPQGEPVAVVSHSLWQQRFAADPDAIGRHLQMNGTSYRVVGVMPASFAMPTPWVQVWLPDVETSQEQQYAGLTHQAVARLGTGWSVSSARAYLARLPPIWSASFTTPPGPSRDLVSRATSMSVAPLRDRFVGPSGLALTLLIAVVVTVLSIACLNVAVLLLSRNAARRREFAVRLALGASPLTLLRQSWLESFMLGVGGSLLGVALAFPSLRIIRDLGPTNVPRLREAVVNSDVLLVALVAAIAASLVSGLLPAWLSRLPSLSAAMGETNRLGENRARLWRRLQAGSLLLISQVALVLVLVVFASLLLHSLTTLLSIDVGFKSTNLLVVSTGGGNSYESVRDLQRATAEIPGVSSVSTVAYVSNIAHTALSAERAPDEWLPMPRVQAQTVSDNYFSALNIPVLAGRTFTPDDLGTPCTLIVDAALAETAWPGQQAVGRTVDLATNFDGARTGRPSLCEVIGVVGNARFDLGVEPEHEIYFSDRSRHGTNYLLVRVAGPSRDILPLIQARAAAIGPSFQIKSEGWMDDVLRAHIVTPPFYAFVFGWMATLALVLGAVGVYAAMAQVVEQRRHEMGVRLAVGAEPADVRRLILRRAAALVGVGIALGLVVAVNGTRWLGAFLFAVGPRDPAVLAVSSAVVIGVSLAAAFGPARRASRIDPRELFKTE